MTEVTRATTGYTTRTRVGGPCGPLRHANVAAVSTTPTRVFVARLVGLPIFDPQGDQVAKVRDLVVAIRTETSQPRVLGMVAEVFGRRRIFVPMTRITAIDSGQVHTTGLLNMRRFEQRSTETLVMGQMLDRTVTIKESGVSGVVYDVAMEQARNRDWVLSRVAVQEPSKGFRRRGQTHVAEWRDVAGLTADEPTQGATHLIAALNDMRPADAANMIHDLPRERRTAVVGRHLLQHVGGALGVEVLEDLDLVLLGQLLQDVGEALVVERCDHGRATLRRQVVDHVGRVGWPHVVERGDQVGGAL